jgi:inner membrane protein
MASLGHIAVGMAAARVYSSPRRPTWRSFASWSALSMLPDADVVGFGLGVRYEDPWGHRGATHSFAFAIVVGIGVGLLARRFKRPAVRTMLFATAVLASHPLLDTLTDGGLGAALFWPFDLTRYFAPWRPIQVAPIGLDFFTTYGLIVGLSELVLFLPLFVYALQTSHFRLQTFAAAALLWLPAAWLVASTDPMRDATVAFILRDRTEYATGYSDARFAQVANGQSHDYVKQLLGAPLSEGWMYLPPGKKAVDVGVHELAGCAGVRFEHDRAVERITPDGCDERGVRVGQSTSDVERILGVPGESCWDYSKGPPGRPFRLCLVCFQGDAVEMIAKRWVF